LKGLPSTAPESKIEAYKWYHLAASQGYKDSAAACDTLTLNMTSAEVADGNHRAAAFLTAKSATA
jgi:TPR repeat protein